MATVKNRCAQCNQDLSITVGQMEINGKLGWYSSYSCPHCHATIETDDTGFPPDAIREALLQEHGEWSIFVDQPSVKNFIGKVLRQHFTVSLSEITRILQGIPGYFMRGTKVEIQWLQRLLNEAGIHSEIKALRDAISDGTEAIELFPITNLKIKE